MRIELAFAVGLLACTSTSPLTEAKVSETPPPAKQAPTPDAKEEAPAPDPELDPARWACDKDSDCTQTCGLGAVSAAWLEAHPNADQCDDGCGWKHGQEACRDGQCVTLDGEGGIDESCTHLTKPLYE